MGQNFSWPEQVGHELEQQRAGNLRSAVRRICLKIECEGFCKPIKGQSKTTKTRICQLFHKNYTIGERTWTYFEPGKQSLSDYPVSKKLIHLLRHGSPPREEDGAIVFWRIKDDLRKQFLYCHHWSDEEQHGRRRIKEKISVLF